MESSIASISSRRVGIRHQSWLSGSMFRDFSFSSDPCAYTAESMMRRCNRLMDPPSAAKADAK